MIENNYNIASICYSVLKIPLFNWKIDKLPGDYEPLFK